MRKLYVKDSSGTWRVVQNLWVKQQDAWIQASKILVKADGIWTPHYIKGFAWNPTLSGEIDNWNLKQEALDAGWDGVTNLVAYINVASDARIGSTATSTYAFDTGSDFPANSLLTLTIDSGAYIVGAGGNGGEYGRSSFNTKSNGLAGGTAMKVRAPLVVINNGIIGGGGGGGGGGMASNTAFGGAGGGGAGRVVGLGGSDGGKPDAEPGVDGTLTTGGAGGASFQSSGAGGAGGNLGQAGATGGTASQGEAGTGGAAGKAVEGNNLVTWSTLGTVYGQRVS